MEKLKTMKATGRGYWVKKDDPNVTIFVEKVFKAGYVTGYAYRREPDGGETILPPVKLTFEEMDAQYERRKQKNAHN